MFLVLLDMISKHNLTATQLLAELSRTDGFLCNVLMMSAGYGRIEMVLALLDTMKKLELPPAQLLAALNQQDKYGDSALIRAIRNNHPQIVQSLLDVMRSLKVSHMELLTVLNQKNNMGYSALMLAIKDGHIDTVQLLLDTMGALELPNTALLGILNDGANGDTALTLAARYDYCQIVQSIIDTMQILESPNTQFLQSLNQQNKFCNNALMIAVLKGHAETVQVLLDAMRTLDLTNEQLLEMLDFRSDRLGWHALGMAVVQGHTETVQVLLDAMRTFGCHGAQVFEALKSVSVQDALFTAVARGHEKTVQIILNTARDLECPVVDILNNHFLAPNAAMQFNSETLISMAAKEGKIQIIKVLLGFVNEPKGKLDLIMRDGVLNRLIYHDRDSRRSTLMNSFCEWLVYQGVPITLEHIRGSNFDLTAAWVNRRMQALAAGTHPIIVRLPDEGAINIISAFLGYKDRAEQAFQYGYDHTQKIMSQKILDMSGSSSDMLPATESSMRRPSVLS